MTACKGQIEKLFKKAHSQKRDQWTNFNILSSRLYIRYAFYLTLCNDKSNEKVDKILKKLLYRFCWPPKWPLGGGAGHAMPPIQVVVENSNKRSMVLQFWAFCCRRYEWENLWYGQKEKELPCKKRYVMSLFLQEQDTWIYLTHHWFQWISTDSITEWRK